MAEGSISGTTVDSSSGPVVGAVVTLGDQKAVSDENGRYGFGHLPAGSFPLTANAPGFSATTVSVTVIPGTDVQVPPVLLNVAAVKTNVEVTLTQTELAQEQIEDQEKQRVFGFLPNYYVSYLPHPAPLTAKQKFELAWKTTIDPVGFAINAAIAGIEQGQNDFKGYGQGAEGYGKRYGASYADFFTSTMLSSAVLPALLKQDPRYYYKGTGSNESRVLYAIENAFIRRGDNGHWQPNYSDIVGNLAAGGISNLYYPASDRNGVSLTIENAAIGIAADAASNLFQEFLSKKTTPRLPPGVSKN